MILNTEKSFGLVSILFHWIMAALFLIQFWIGLTMESEPVLAAKQALIARHVSIGILILALWAIRIVWTLCNRRPALPGGMQQGERRLPRASHVLLLALFGIIPLTGWLLVSTMGGLLPFQIFGLFALPRFGLGASLHAAGIWSVFHAFLAYFMLILAAVHALAALRHQFTLKDGLMVRMLLPGRSLIDE
ncbi:cytochrome b [Rhizobium sp. C4]|uniref:cytochrome b n=1 Tax=Rhizobium sp. C4 TaxID=1349800 RepID=UPI001E537887|nr:cytochrome b/b6 domain-containing protein [Rhizobium sp. C4]MCD2171680.1 cytochrome b/b6 domain-containing protein [Rhizobium sp. C4]